MARKDQGPVPSRTRPGGAEWARGGAPAGSASCGASHFAAAGVFRPAEPRSELPASAAELSPSASAPVLVARRKPLPISAAPLQSVAPASAGSLSEAVSLERLSKFPIRGAKTLAQPLPYLARESPKLLVELQLFAETELRRRAPGGGPSEAALEVWLETFERFVGAFKTYGPVLRPLRAEADARLRELADRAAAAEAEAAAAWTTQQTAEAAAAGREANCARASPSSKRRARSGRRGPRPPRRGRALRCLQGGERARQEAPPTTPCACRRS